MWQFYSFIIEFTIQVGVQVNTQLVLWGFVTLFCFALSVKWNYPIHFSKYIGSLSKRTQSEMDATKTYPFLVKMYPIYIC